MSILTLSGNEVVTIAGRSGTAVGYITPAATFTATTASSAAAGAKTTLTSAGAHGLTAAVAVGKPINITAGTGWAAGFYNISSIDLDTAGVAITIDVAYDAGMGTPTIALAGTESTFATIAIPPLATNSHIEVDVSWSYVNSVNSKIARIRFGGSVAYGASVTTSVLARPSSVVIQNRGATNSQVCSFNNTASAAQNGTTASAITTLSIDTSAATSLTITGTSATANEYIYCERYIVKVFK